MSAHLLRKNWNKLFISIAIVSWAVYNLFPLKDHPFEEFIVSRAKADKEEFAKIVSKAKDNTKNTSLFVSLKNLASEEKIDLSKFFPDFNLIDIKNLTRKNEIVLNELLRLSKCPLKKGLDLAGGVSFTLAMEDKSAEESRFEKESKMSQAIEVMGNRINALGITEPIIRAKGDSEIEVQLPGVSTQDNPEIISLLKKPAKLEFRLIHSDLIPKKTPKSKYPIGYEILALEKEDSEETEEPSLFVKRIPELSGKYVKHASVMITPYGGYEIGLSFTDEGTRLFAEVTKKNIQKRLGIVLDGKLYSAPVVQSEIKNGHASISGTFTQRQAIELSNVLNNPLEFELKVTEMYEIGPSLAKDAQASSIYASIIGACAIIIFMIAYYAVPGIVAVISVLTNVLIVLGVLISLGATMTLPGVAALVLTIGMGVDSNILIFERMREELQNGKSLPTALFAGHERAFSTIIDSNLTTLLTAGILIWFGTGPIKGFGVVLAIGIFATMFCTLIISRLVLELLINSGILKKAFSFCMFKHITNFDFIGKRKKAFIFSWIIVLIGLIGLFIKGDRIYGIDFLGGDEITLSFKEKIDTQEIEKIIKQKNLGESVSIYQKLLGQNNEILKVSIPEGNGRKTTEILKKTFPNAEFSLLGETKIGATVGSQIKWNAIISMLLALVGILIYVSIRFEIGYAMGAIVSTIHDILLTVGIYILLGKQFSAPMVAAVLMIIGYSINDTIVVFDRIREEIKMNPFMSLANLINLATNKTLSRTILTSFTTLVSALALYLFGAGAVGDYSLIFIIGILTGTFSSIFIATPVFFWWHKGDRKHLENKEDVLPTYEWDAGSRK